MERLQEACQRIRGVCWQGPSEVLNLLPCSGFGVHDCETVLKFLELVGCFLPVFGVAHKLLL